MGHTSKYILRRPLRKRLCSNVRITVAVRDQADFTHKGTEQSRRK